MCGSNLATTLRIFKNGPTSRSVKICFCVTSQGSARERVLELNLSDTSAEGDGLGGGAGMLTSPQIPTNPL
jgi:hypothetical protein